jgi:thymidylate kinase
MAGRRRGRGQVLALEGISGSGKSTVAPRLARALDAEFLPEAYDRLRPRPSLAFRTERGLLRLEQRLLEEDAARYREADQVAGGGGSVVVDTGFFGPLTYARALAHLGLASGDTAGTLLRSARSLSEQYRWGAPDRILWLDTTPSTRRAHVRSDPAGHPADLTERHERVGQEERRIYLEVLRATLGARLTVLDANGPVDRVVRRAEAAVAAGPHGFAPEGLPERVVRALEVDLGQPL